MTGLLCMLKLAYLAFFLYWHVCVRIRIILRESIRRAPDWLLFLLKLATAEGRYAYVTNKKPDNNPQKRPAGNTK